MAMYTLRIPCGKGGLNSMETVGEFPVEDLLHAQNLTFEDDTWQKEPGAAKLNTTAISGTPAVVGLHYFESVPAVVAATSDGKIITVVTGGIGTTLKTGLGSNKLTVFVEVLGAASTQKVVSFNGYDQPQVWDGVAANTSNLATPPTDWTGTDQPPAGVMHHGRLFAWLGHNIYYSTVTDHEDFTSAGSGVLRVYPGEGEKIVAAVSFAGRLFIFKSPYGIYWLDDSDYGTPANWFIKKLSSVIGMAGPLGLAMVDTDVLFLGSDALIHQLTTVQEFGDVRASSVLHEKLGGYLRSTIKMSRLDRANAYYHSLKREWSLNFTSSGSSVNDRRLTVDVHNPESPRCRWSDRDVAEAACMYSVSGLRIPIIGDDSGVVWKLDQETRSKEGAAYIARFETGEIPLFEGGARRGNLKEIELIFKPTGVHNLSLEIFKDGVLAETILVDMGSIGAALGSFILDTDILGTGGVLNRIKKLSGDARRIKLAGYNGGVGQNFSLSEILIHFTKGSRRK